MSNATKPILTLKQFMLRQQVLGLYRKILRTIRQVPDEQSRSDLQAWARNDFKNNKHHTEEVSIKILMNYGERNVKELQTSLNLSK